MSEGSREREEAWRWLASDEGAVLRARVQDWLAPVPAQVTALRKEFSQEVVHAALQWARGRAKAIAKFGEAGCGMWADPEGVEMASGPMPAAWKARRFARVVGKSGGVVFDVCCGIGADAMAIRWAGVGVRCVDIDPVRAWMAGRNVASESVARDAGELVKDDGVWRDGVGKDVAALHVDPARRGVSGRVWKIGDVEPGPEVLKGLLARRRDAAIKLSPGLNHAEVREQLLEPCGLADEAQVEVISQRGKLVQGVVWTGKLAWGEGEDVRAKPSARRATLLTEKGSWSIAGEADCAHEIETLPLSRFFFEVDDAIERAELLTTLARASVRVPLAMAHPKLGLFVTKGEWEAVPEFEEHVGVWFRSFELIAEMSWNERKVAERLKQLGAHHVEVKTRDGVVNPDELQTKLCERKRAKFAESKDRDDVGRNPSGEKKFTKTGQVVGRDTQFPEKRFVLFVLRFGQSLRAIVARRVCADV